MMSTSLSTQVVVDDGVLDYEPAPPKPWKPQLSTLTPKSVLGIRDVARPSARPLSISKPFVMAQPVETPM